MKINNYFPSMVFFIINTAWRGSRIILRLQRLHPLMDLLRSTQSGRLVSYSHIFHLFILLLSIIFTIFLSLSSAYLIISEIFLYYSVIKGFMSLCHKLKLYFPYIFATRFCKPLIFQAYIIQSKRIHSF